MNRFLRKKQNFLFFLFLMSSLLVHAADPTTSASNVQFPVSYIDGGEFRVSFTSGNGTGGRIVVVKEGSEITGVPVDGTKYNFNTVFGTAGTEFTATGEFVVAHTTGTAPTITVTGLKPGTTYYVAIFELNGTYSTPSTIDYSSVTPTGKNVTTLSAPSVAADITGFRSEGGTYLQVGGNSLRIYWNKGDGQGRIIVAKKGNSLTALPGDLTAYNYNTAFGLGTAKLDAETFVVYRTASSSLAAVDITNLEPNTPYTFAIFEYNGTNSPVYLKTAVTKTIMTNAGPTVGTGTINIGALQGNSISFTCNRGNGAKRIIIAKKGSSVTSIPVNGTIYPSNSVFGTINTEIVAGSGEYVVYAGTGAVVTVTNLELFTTYHFAIYEYDEDANGYTYYLTAPQSSTLPSRKSQSTLLPPTANTTLAVSNITGSSAQLTYVYPSSGYGDYRLLAIRDGSPVEFLPEDLKTYTGSGSYNYGTGQLVGPDTYVLIAGSNGGAPKISGLTPGHTYYVTVFDHNGTTGPVYLRPGSSAIINVPNEPTTGATMPTFPTVEGNYVRFDWTAGTGAKRMVVVRKGAPVINVPQDGSNYTAAPKFGDGTELVPGSAEFVVYNDQNNSVTVTGLEKATTYHFAVFEYNTGASGPDYLTASARYLITSQATLSAPTTQVSNLNAINILSDRATINFGVGNGTSRVFVMREGVPVDAEPTEFKVYNIGAASYGNSAYLIGTGNYAVSNGNVSSFTVTGLKAGTQYYITAFEYNGSSAPVYLRPGATMYDFTTTGGVVITAPTQTAGLPVFENVDGNKFNFKWTNGNGANRIVVARKGSAVSFVPVDGTTYTANASFGSNTDLGGGHYVVYNGNGSSAALTNLEPNTIYHFAVFEYNGTGATTKYGSAFKTSNSTATPPTIKSSDPSATPGANSITVSWVNGNGAGRIVVAREGSEITATPSDLTKYVANGVFKNGPQITAGEYIVYAGAGNAVTVTGLEANKTYHFSVFEYNGIDAPVYNTADVLKTSATVSSTLPVTWLYVNAGQKNGNVIVEWATSQEINTDFFVVEKSTDGIIFNSVATVTASGNSSQNTRYAVTDQANPNGKIYYRIKQVDTDGRFTYSWVVSVANHTTHIVRLLQNPVHDQLKFQCGDEQAGANFMIVDALGKMVRKGVITSAITTLYLSGMSNGTYYLIVQDKKDGKATTIAFNHN